MKLDFGLGVDTVSFVLLSVLRRVLKGSYKNFASPSIFLGVKSVSIEPKRITKTSGSKAGFYGGFFPIHIYPLKEESDQRSSYRKSQGVGFFESMNGGHPLLIADQHGS